MERLVPDGERAGPTAGLREALAVEEDATELPDEVPRLLERRNRPVPDEVEGERVLGGLEDDADATQSFEDLDPKRADGRVHAVAELTGGAHHVVRVAAA